MSWNRAAFLLVGMALTGPVSAHPHEDAEAGATFVAVSVEIDGRPASLYPAPDGSGRFYLEARKGARYAVTLANRTADRVGVVLTVDGLNVISGRREEGRGRMYVLDPWQRTTVRGWRTSLQEVRRFTFVDEQASYAARSGKANEKMGWIEVAVYRERWDVVQARPRLRWPEGPEPVESERGRERAEAPAAAPTGSEHGQAGAPSAEAPAAGARDTAEAQAPTFQGETKSYPGTGWGQRTRDPVVLVSFDPEPDPCERVTLRYEYRPALVALGVLPRRPPPRDRLWERDRAQSGFAQPPIW
jgi:hypothetical protein